MAVEHHTDTLLSVTVASVDMSDILKEHFVTKIDFSYGLLMAPSDTYSWYVWC